jgi:hypothetical protein
MSGLIAVLAILLFGFALGYGVREIISRRRHVDARRRLRKEPTGELRGDLEAELSPRNDQLPSHSIWHETDVLTNAANEVSDQLWVDSKHLEQVERDVQAELKLFAESLTTRKR